MATRSTDIDVNGQILNRMMEAEDPAKFVMEAANYCKWHQENKQDGIQAKPGWDVLEKRLREIVTELKQAEHRR